MLCWGWTVKVSQLIKCLFCGSCVVSSSFRSWGPNLHKHFEKKPVWITDVRIIHCRCKKCITLMKLPGIMNFRLAHCIFCSKVQKSIGVSCRTSQKSINSCPTSHTLWTITQKAADKENYLHVLRAQKYRTSQFNNWIGKATSAM